MGLSKLDVSMAFLNADVALSNRKNNLNQVIGSISKGGLNESRLS
jgi:hypothetical protein